MATENLQVKFKVDTTEVKSGADEAKNKVKQAAQSMEGDVKKASSSMSNSLKEISRSTDQIGQSARKATGELGEMEGRLKNVSRQMSAMTMFRMGARGVDMLSGVASNVLKLQGNYEGAENVQAAGKIAGGAFQGAAMGFAMGGPMGAAVGGLVGAGNALLDAAVAQKEAAAALMKGSVKTIEDIEERYQTRTAQEGIARQAAAKDFNVDAAQKQIRDARLALEQAKENQRIAQDNLYGRNGGINWMDEGQRKAFVEQERERLYGKKGERGWGQAIAEWTDPMLDKKNNDPETIVAEQYKLFAEEAQNAEKEVERAQKLLSMLAPLQARIDEEVQKTADKWQNANAGYWKEFDDYQNGGPEKKKLSESEKNLSSLQAQLQGLIKNPMAGRVTDSLTRMGGGRGYSSYNDSTVNIQKNIEAHLKTLIADQKANIQTLTDELRQIRYGLTSIDPFAQWGH